LRFYGVAIASLAIDAPEKWTDNLLSQHDIPDVLSGRRGVARRVSRVALVRIALIRQLHVLAGLAVAEAVAVAEQLLASVAGEVRLGRHLTLSLDLPSLERELDHRLSDALESAPAPRRGRPPRRLSG
jgi:hypothetical protein